MRTDNDLMPNDVADALARTAEPMTDTARADVRHRIMSSIRHDSHAHYFASLSHRFAAAAVAATVLGGGVAYAAGDALPGDALYGVKRATEQALIAILPSGTIERSVLVGVAGRRAGEAAHLAIEGATSDLLDATMSDLRSAVTAATSASGALAGDEVERIQEQASDAPQQTREAISNVVAPAEGSPTDSGSPSDTGEGSQGGDGTSTEPGGSNGQSSGVPHQSGR